VPSPTLETVSIRKKTPSIPRLTHGGPLHNTSCSVRGRAGMVIMGTSPVFGLYDQLFKYGGLLEYDFSSLRPARQHQMCGRCPQVRCRS
jgi:hypothetical protein